MLQFKCAREGRIVDPGRKPAGREIEFKSMIQAQKEGTEKPAEGTGRPVGGHENPVKEKPASCTGHSELEDCL